MESDDPRAQQSGQDEDIEALNCDWDVEVMQFLIDSFICLFPVQHCGDCSQDYCNATEETTNCFANADGSCCYATEAPKRRLAGKSDLCQALNSEYRLDKTYTFDGNEDDDDNDGILEGDADAFGCNFCHAMGS